MTAGTGAGDGLDRQVLDKLEASIGRDMVVVLVAEFLDGVGGRLDKIEQAVATGNADLLIRQTHDLGSEAGSLGAMTLHLAARAIETDAKMGNLADACQKGAALRAVAAPGLAALRQTYGEG